MNMKCSAVGTQRRAALADPLTEGGQHKRRGMRPWKVSLSSEQETRPQANLLHLCNLVDKSTMYFKVSVHLTALIYSY